MNIKLLVLITMLMALTVSGCETMQGLGKDLQNLGDQLEKNAKDSE